MYEVCDICFCNVDMDYVLDHKAWHRSLSPAPTREDRSGASEPWGVVAPPDNSVFRERDPVAGRPDMAMMDPDPDYDTCLHEWPSDYLGPNSRCELCGLRYGSWRVGR